MDKEELQQKIALYYSKLPPNMQELFSSMAWLETIKIISEKYSLSDEQASNLGSNTTLVLLGIIHPDEYQEILKKEINISSEKLDQMLFEINNSVIKNVRGDLVKSYGGNLADLIEESAEKDEIEGEESLIENNIDVEEKLDERFSRLPKEILKVVSDSNYQATVYNISKKYNLNVSQMGVFEKAVTNLIIGSISPERLEDYLNDHLDISKEKLKGMVGDVNEEIFKKIREKTMLLGQTNEKENEILKQAGINIISSEHLPGGKEPLLEITGGTENIKREDLIKGIEKPEPVKPQTLNPILAQKLSGTVQNKIVHTEHTLENLSSSTKESATTKTNKAPYIDPYREIPE